MNLIKNNYSNNTFHIEITIHALNSASHAHTHTHKLLI